MNSYLEMTMVKKEQGQDDYFSQQGIILTITSLPYTEVRIRPTRPNWKYISTAQDGQELAHGVVLPKSSVQRH